MGKSNVSETRVSLEERRGIRNRMAEARTSQLKLAEIRLSLYHHHLKVVASNIKDNLCLSHY